mmetsp:Transcript_17404/g.29160  ORF Transcript_17404/g.29160 Transcript_17404/m.29160 type:complete len:309 (+) Transcript_17404:96-1022(+)|eukprot:CAMPEP_0114427696 /NCGR_PEP_ID=MMETSP0103-20121206/8500_1 /TAXON_ID=37642 ORGANISM="Paraphysomonas imperforata, Strain PA2" /NCGR_SAMPLE_ID=MMETSP0103 /ASSEMBLY_ACC=CAM_ASM_000201 /LENGTH=308 /DNA_ID=CAMNT_0001596803 /DNA_START=95 /DNA_END=1021 /DNA_ORIENTATION=-
MGGDGGVFAVNRKFFSACRNTSKDGQTDATENEERQIKLTKRFVKCKTCAISNELLVEPVVACRLGFLYNKESLITALLEKTLHHNFSHIKGLKSVKQVVLTPNSDVGGGGRVVAGSGGKEDSDVSSPYMCPVTQLPFNGLYSFVVIWTTGHVLSEKALREIGMEGLQLEYGPFTEADVVALLPAEEELSSRRAALEAQAELAQKAKQEKKRSRNKEKAEGGATMSGKEEADLGLSKKARVKDSAGGAGPLALGAGSSVVAEAKSSVAASKSKSALYDKLFHKNPEQGGEKLSDRDLFMSVAGIRYTL